MSALGPILAMATGMYALRIAGFLLARATVPPALEEALRFVPVAMLTALVVSTLISRPDEEAVRLAATVGAGLAAWRTGRGWVCIVGGIALYWLFRLV